MSRIILVDVPGSGLGRLGRELEKSGLKTERVLGEVPVEERIGSAGLLGVIVHYRRAGDIPALRSLPELAVVPVVIWYPATASAKQIEQWTRTGALDFMVGSAQEKEVRARMHGLSYSRFMQGLNAEPGIRIATENL